MQKVSKVFLMLLVVLSCICIPNKVFAADTYYWSTTNAGYDYNLFQENITNQLDTDAIIAMTPLGAYKFVFYDGTNYIAMNSTWSGYSTDVQSLLKTMDSTQKDETFKFSLFDVKSDYTPKEYLNMLNKSKIYIYDTENNLVDSMNTLDYQKYTKFPDSSNFNVKLDKYINDGESVTGVSVVISWDLNKNETPIALTILNDKINYKVEYDMQNSPRKNSLNAALDLQYNGEYTFVLDTSDCQYAKKVKFDKLPLNVLSKEEKQKPTKYKETSSFDDANIKISVSDIPKSLEQGKSFKLTVSTNVETNVDVSGRVDSEYKKSHNFNITDNGTYTIVATSEAGRAAKKTIKVNCFKEPKDTGLTYYDRDNYWNGTKDTINNNQAKLVQTGMYDNTVVVVAILCLLFGVMLLVQVLRKVGITWKRK